MFLFVTIFIVLPIVAVYFLYRLPIRGDYQFQLLWRGAVAGVVGQFIGSGVGGYPFVVSVYVVVWAFLPLLLFTTVIGMIFILIIAGIQKIAFELNLLARSLAGGLIGVAAFSAWFLAVASNYSNPRVGKWFASVMIATGIIAGILCRPRSKEMQKESEQSSNSSRAGTGEGYF